MKDRKRIYNPDKAGYVFCLEEIDPITGLYNICGVTTEESNVEEFLKSNVHLVKRVQVFTLGSMYTNAIQTITSIEEFMEFQQ